jgi:hypothetical protein
VLKYYLKLGLKVTKVHRCFSFNQSKWMEPFINLNIKHRMDASKLGDEVKKGFFKLMNNSVYGKTMQNVREYESMKFTLSPSKAQRWFNRPDCSGVHIYNNHADVEKPLVYCTFTKRIVKMNQPIVVGSTVLDHSKHMIYNIWYDKLKPKWGDNIQLLYQDTDSLVIKVNSPNYYKDLQDIRDIIDFTGFNDRTHPVFEGIDYDTEIEPHKDVLGRLKSETKDSEIQEFIALKAKQYSFVVNDKSTMKNKGLPGAVAKSRLCHKDFLDSLLKATTLSVTFKTIRSHKHQVGIDLMEKIAVTCYDDKRYYLNALESLPYGHYKIAEIEK